MSTKTFPSSTVQDVPRIGALLRHAWEGVRERIYTGVLQDGYDDLTRGHVALFRYEGLDGRRPSQLADSMQITKQSVNDLLRYLEKRGYLKSDPDPKDRRARLVRLTSRGRRFDASVRAHARAAERELAKAIGQASFCRFYKMLLKINAIVDDRSRSSTISA
ncbi:MAG TPA: MarR family transcriptional regulator [Terriglobales bacterium]|jgi:DNA-binding MarR family transcriptional regulator|nr:MarR family transcriptional regulator [Terriglobales bacterium]